MSSDTLTTTSRAFFERAKAKVAVSIALSGAGLMLLGFTSASGGLSANAGSLAKSIKNSNDDNQKTAYNDLAAGYGFAAFVFILAFFLLIAAAIYVSPLICGSNNEKKMLNSPQEIDSGNYAAYTENPGNSTSKV